MVFVSSEVNHPALVGWEDLKLLRVIPASFPAVTAAAAEMNCFDKLKGKMLSTYTEVFSNQLGVQPMKVPPMNKYLKDNAVPYRVSGPRPLPQRFEEAAQAEKDQHIASGALTKCDEPTYWCAPGFFSFILLIHEGSHREVYREFQPSYDIFCRWCQGLFRPQVPCTPRLHCPNANSVSTQSQRPV